MRVDSSYIGRRGDHLFAAERNAIIFYANDQKDAAARCLGWSLNRHPELGDYEDFIDREIERIREKVRRTAERKESTMRMPALEEPDRLDEGDQLPPPTEDDRLDEREEEMPPPPPRPPQSDPEDVARAA